MSDEQVVITYEEAIALLPAGDKIHTFRQAGPMLLGADHDRGALLSAMLAAPEIQVTGAVAQSMNHGLAIQDDIGWLFIATIECDGRTH